MRCAIYCRVSSEDQVKGSSLQTQEEACRVKAKQLGATEVTVFVEPGVSGDTLDRPALTAMRDQLQQKAFDLVILHDPDRMARRLALQLIITDDIIRAGARLEFVLFDYQDTPDGRLFYSMLGAISEFEREKILERTMRGRRQKAQEGRFINGTEPYGYRFNPETDRLEVDEAAAGVVRMMYAWAVDGLGVRAITQRLAETGVSPPGLRGKPPGRLWWPDTVQRILRSETYKGQLMANRYDIRKVNGRRVSSQRPRREWRTIPVPVIIDEVTWAAAQRGLDAHRRPQGHWDLECLVRGIAVCAECGTRLTVQTKVKTNGKRYCYYHCATAYSRAAYTTSGDTVYLCSQRGTIRTEELDALVWDAIQPVLHRASDEAAPSIETGVLELIDRQTAFIDARVKEVVTARERTLHAFQREIIDEDTLAVEMKRLATQKDDLGRELRQLQERRQRQAFAAQEAIRIREYLKALAPDLSTLDFLTKRRVVAAVVEKVVVRHQPDLSIEVQSIAVGE